MTPVDSWKLGFMVYLPDAGIHKIDGFALKIKYGWQEHLNIPRKVRFFRSEMKMTQMEDKFKNAHVPLSENFRILLY